MNIIRLAETETTLTITDRLWRAEMQRAFGPDGVLLHGFGMERQGALGTQLRQTFEARKAAVAAWRRGGMSGVRQLEALPWTRP